MPIDDKEVGMIRYPLWVYPLWRSPIDPELNYEHSSGNNALHQGLFLLGNDAMLSSHSLSGRVSSTPLIEQPAGGALRDKIADTDREGNSPSWLIDPFRIYEPPTRYYNGH